MMRREPYDIGTHYYFLGEYDNAVTTLNLVREVGAELKLSGEALYFVGRAHQKRSIAPLNGQDPDIVAARAAYNAVITRYATCARAADARARLDVLP